MYFNFNVIKGNYASAQKESTFFVSEVTTCSAKSTNGRRKTRNDNEKGIKKILISFFIYTILDPTRRKFLVFD